MKKQLATILAVGLVLTFLVSAQAQTGKIVTIDLNRVFNEYYKTPSASANLKTTAETFNKEHTDMMNEYKTMIDELNKLREEQDRPEYTAEVRDQKRRQLTDRLAEAQKRQREIEEYRRSHQQILEQQTQRMRQTLLKEINDVVVKEAQEAGYMLVLDRSGNTLNGVPTVIFAQDALDITDSIVKILNKNVPTAPGAGAPAP